MSNIDFFAKHGIETQRSTKQKVQFAINIAIITAAFLFVAAAVAGIFP